MSDTPTSFEEQIKKLIEVRIIDNGVGVSIDMPYALAMILKHVLYGAQEHFVEKYQNLADDFAQAPTDAQRNEISKLSVEVELAIIGFNNICDKMPGEPVMPFNQPSQSTTVQ